MLSISNDSATCVACFVAEDYPDLDHACCQAPFWSCVPRILRRRAAMPASARLMEYSTCQPARLPLCGWAPWASRAWWAQRFRLTTATDRLWELRTDAYASVTLAKGSPGLVDSRWWLPGLVWQDHIRNDVTLLQMAVVSGCRARGIFALGGSMSTTVPAYVRSVAASTISDSTGGAGYRPTWPRDIFDSDLARNLQAAEGVERENPP